MMMAMVSLTVSMMIAMGQPLLILLETLEHVNSLLKPLVTMDSIMMAMRISIAMTLIASPILLVLPLLRFVIMDWMMMAII